MPYKDKERRQSEEYKEYQRNYQRSWHQRHRTERLVRMYERKAAIHKYFQNMKNQLCCVDCGQRHPATLHFHHLNSGDKDFDISYAVNSGVSIDRIKKEIEKCIVLCANCHAIRHYNMRNEKQTNSGIMGDFEKLDTILQIGLEEDAHNIDFFEES